MKTLIGSQFKTMVIGRFWALMFLGLFPFTWVQEVHSEPYAYPVPFVTRNIDHTKIFFRDLPGAGNIRILTVTGDEVVTLSIPIGAGQIDWNVRNSSGKPVATGVYFYEIDAAGQQTIGKLVVIR